MHEEFFNGASEKESTHPKMFPSSVGHVTTSLAEYPLVERSSATLNHSGSSLVLQASMMALLGLGPRMLLCALSLMHLQAGTAAVHPLGPATEQPLGPLRDRRQGKRKRILSLAGIGGISDRALVKVLAAVREEPELLTDGTSQTEIARAGKAIWESVGQTDELELTKGGTFTWFHSRPSAVLNFLLATCPVFSTFPASRLQASPCTPTSPW